MIKPSQLHWEHLPDACISTLTWTLVAVVISFGIFRNRTLVYSNRVVSLLHALVALPLCISAARYWYPLPYFGQRTTTPEVTEPPCCQVWPHTVPSLGTVMDSCSTDLANTTVGLACIKPACSPRRAYGCSLWHSTQAS